MAQVQRLGALGFAVVAAFLCIELAAQAGDPATLIQQKPISQINLTKATASSVDAFVKTVSEVITVQPAEGQGDQGNQGYQGGQQAAAASADQAPPPDIAPPPPPADTPPPTIALGHTIEEVIAGFGQPVRIAKLGVKEIFYYKDMKVTFTNGKVSNVE
jgi:hypothetical protein